MFLLAAEIVVIVEIVQNDEEYDNKADHFYIAE